MASLQDQLLKAGLADKASAKQARADKRKKQKQKNKQKQPVVDLKRVESTSTARKRKALDSRTGQAAYYSKQTTA